MYYLNPISLPINSSPFYLFPRQQFRTSTDQIKLGCRIIQFAHLFKKQIDKYLNPFQSFLTLKLVKTWYSFWDSLFSQSLTQDFGSGHGKGQPLCMQTYKHFFSAYRIPGEEKDELLLSKPQNNDSEHIIIACRNQVCLLLLLALINLLRNTICLLLFLFI